jgi:hypothetical protein
MATVGVPLTFDVTGTDDDPDDTVSLSAADVPPAATLSPNLPTVGNPVTTTFDWTPGTADVGTHVVIFTSTDSRGNESSCTATIEVAECFLVLGKGMGAESFQAGGHTWTTQLSGIEFTYPVTMEDIPTFGSPANPGSKVRQVAPVPIGLGTAQVLMWNPQVFPANAEQWSRVLLLTFWSDGSVTSTTSGTRNGMDISLELVRVSAGVELIRFPFGIDGF